MVVLTYDDALGSQHQRHNNPQFSYLHLLLWQRDGLQLELGLEYRQTNNNNHTMQHTCISLQDLQFCVIVLE